MTYDETPLGKLQHVLWTHRSMSTSVQMIHQCCCCYRSSQCCSGMLSSCAGVLQPSIWALNSMHAVHLRPVHILLPSLYTPTVCMYTVPACCRLALAP
jgi:hypothetical protein